jgi:hypothetical protein
MPPHIKAVNAPENENARIKPNNPRIGPSIAPRAFDALSPSVFHARKASFQWFAGISNRGNNRIVYNSDTLVRR